LEALNTDDGMPTTERLEQCAAAARGTIRLIIAYGDDPSCAAPAERYSVGFFLVEDLCSSGSRCISG
jgi:hypothetical protein